MIFGYFHHLTVLLCLQWIHRVALFCHIPYNTSYCNHSFDRDCRFDGSAKLRPVHLSAVVIGVLGITQGGKGDNGWSAQ